LVLSRAALGPDKKRIAARHDLKREASRPILLAKWSCRWQPSFEDDLGRIGNEMGNQEKRAVDAKDHHTDNDNPQKSADFDSVLQLISAQVEDTHRQQSRLLEQLAERLERLELGAQAVREKFQSEETHDQPEISSSPGTSIPADFPERSPGEEVLSFDDKPESPEDWDEPDTHSLDRVANDLAHLTDQFGSPTSSSRASSEAVFKGQQDWNNEATTPQWNAEEQEPIEFQDEFNSTDMPTSNDFNETMEPDLWVDNAADKEPEQNRDDEVPIRSQLTNKAAVETSSVAPAGNLDTPRDEAPLSTTTKPEADLPKSTTELWSSDDAERLMQVYEQEMFKGHEQADELPREEYINTSRSLDTPTENPSQVLVDSTWLEERFAQIATRIEQTLVDIRSQDPVNVLRERFAHFQEDIAGALADLATRADLDGLKAAEAKIEELRTHFAHVENQMARLDSVEKQLEAVMDRLSDDRLMTLLAPQGGSSFNQDELALAIGQYVASHASSNSDGVTGNPEKLNQLQETLTSFIEEQRAGKDQQLGVLDTLQDAMVQLLDRADSPCSRYCGTQDFTDPTDAPQHMHEDMTSLASREEGAEHYVPAAFEPFDPAQEHSRLDPRNAQEPGETAEDLKAMSVLAIEAATQAADRHEGFEPFSQEAATSAQILTDSKDTLADTDNGADDNVVDGSTPANPSNAPTDMGTPTANTMSGEAMNPSPAGHPEQVPQHQDMGPHGNAPLNPARQTAHNDHSSPSGNSVARLRQEFIVDAQRAKVEIEQRAAEVALLNEQEPKSKGFSLFGFSLGGKSSGKKATTPARPQAGQDYENASDSKIFGMSRKKVFIGAFILMIASSGILLMIPRTAPKIPAPQAIERVIPKNLSTNPEVIPQGQSPKAAGENIPTQSPFKTTPEKGTGPMGDRSQIIEPWSRTLGRLQAPGREAVAYLDGLTLQTPNKPVTQRDLDRLAQQRSMAYWSLKIGDAASRATTSSLLPEYQTAVVKTPAREPAPVQKTALHVSQNPSESETSAQKSSKLDLPPSTVGPFSLRLAAAKGDPSAEFEVATRLAAGKGTNQNFKKAVKWYARSASKGFAQSQYRLGTFYERGLGVKKDTARARIWYRRAAEQGNTKAMHNLAVLSAGRTKGAPDYATAANWFSKAAKYGLADSQYNLAVLYENGLGVKKDMKSAYKFYALAAGSGDNDAIKRRDAVLKNLTTADALTAKAQVKGWRRKNPDKLANDAFAAGQAWKTRASNAYTN